jgi:2-dehydro-3-deoxyphosphooctonate aldolase (KDO 8-P synthase)
MPVSPVHVGSITVGPGRPLLLIAGPCVIESEDLCLRVAQRVAAVAERLKLPYVFKASFDKANRSSPAGFRGPGLDKGLAILAKVKATLGLPVLSDVHGPEQCGPAGQVLDVVQIPAFLCRQTDLIVAAAKTGRPLNIKKGQFMSPAEMGNAVEKAAVSGNRNVLLTERGTFFGYNNLVNDMTAIADMHAIGRPVIFDATHSCQKPGALGAGSGGRPENAPLLARAAVAAGADGLFIEVHPEPRRALSDAATMLSFEELESLLPACAEIRDVVHRAPAP